MNKYDATYNKRGTVQNNRKNYVFGMNMSNKNSGQAHNQKFQQGSSDLFKKKWTFLLKSWLTYKKSAMGAIAINNKWLYDVIEYKGNRFLNV